MFELLQYSTVAAQNPTNEADVGLGKGLLESLHCGRNPSRRQHIAVEAETARDIENGRYGE